MESGHYFVLMCSQRQGCAWLLCLFESFGGWYSACAEQGIWHVAISYTGVCSIDEEIKHVNIPMDLCKQPVEAVVRACFHLTGFLLPSNLVGIVASPPCTTYSNFDCKNQIHRDYSYHHRPAKSLTAKQHDAMILGLMLSIFPHIQNEWHVAKDGSVAKSATP